MEIELSSDEELDVLRFDLYKVPRVAMDAEELVEQFSGLDVGSNRGRAFVLGFELPLERIDVDR
jgi:hypothetical protein